MSITKNTYYYQLLFNNCICTYCYTPVTEKSFCDYYWELIC